MYGHLEDETNVRLLRDVDDIESHRAGVSGPPSFVGQSEALQYQMKRTETKIKQLHDLHLRHIRRPTMDEVSQEEADIKSLGLEITQVRKYQRQITLRIVGYLFSSGLTATLNLCLVYFKIT